MEEQYTEKPENKGSDDNVKRYLREIELSLKNEESWRKDADEAWKVYRSNSVPGETRKKKDTFNILWANTEIKRHNLYNALPEADIRPRHAKKDPVAEAVSELLERGVSYTLECQDVHEKMKLAVMDMLVPSRGGLRVRYKPTMEGEEVAYEECGVEHFQWDDFIMGPGKEYDEVPWQAWRHYFTKDEIEERFPEFVDKLSYDVEEKTEDKDKTVFKKTTVYELWDKDERKVYWLGKDYKDAFLKVVDDPLNLKRWFPCPRPLRAIEDSASTVPITEYGQYQTQAEELEKVSRRRNKLIDAIRARFVYDSRFKEIESLLEEDDAGMVPAEGIASILESGGLDKAIWGLPLNDLVNVYQVLGQQRNELVAQIYELTGISDIIRGDTNPNETKGAQEIKANFATSRLERQKQEVEIFARDLVRLIAEIISEFSRETLSVMTGMDFPTEEQLLPIKMRLQMMQQSGMASDPQAQQQIQQLQSQASQVTWEQVEEILHSDLMRDYRVDIETDSTIATDRQREQESIGAYLHAMGQFSKMMQDGMNTGLIPPEAARKTLAEVSRKFNLGSEIAEIYEQPMPPKPDPEAEKAQAEERRKQQEHAQKMQFEDLKLQHEKEKLAMEKSMMRLEHSLEQQKARTEMMMDRMGLNIEVRKLDLEGEKLEMQEEAAQAEHKRKMTEAKKPRDAA